MPEVSYYGEVARLRAGTPMATKTPGRFVLHTFMVEVSGVDFISCTESLPASTQFRGQGGNLMSASFSRLNVKGGDTFSGKKVYSPRYEPETFLD